MPRRTGTRRTRSSHGQVVEEQSERRSEGHAEVTSVSRVILQIPKRAQGIRGSQEEVADVINAAAEIICGLHGEFNDSFNHFIVQEVDDQDALSGRVSRQLRRRLLRRRAVRRGDPRRRGIEGIIVPLGLSVVDVGNLMDAISDMQGGIPISYEVLPPVDSHRGDQPVGNQPVVEEQPVNEQPLNAAPEVPEDPTLPPFSVFLEAQERQRNAAAAGSRRSARLQAIRAARGQLRG